MVRKHAAPDIFFIRANRELTGGAEIYLSRLVGALEQRGIALTLLHSPLPRATPSWLGALLFNLFLCLRKRGRFYFSLERITCPDVYRAGDGVHRCYLQLEKKVPINPLHPVYLFLEKRCFRNAVKIIANSRMVKQQIIDTYRIPAAKIAVVYNGIPPVAEDYVVPRTFFEEFSLTGEEKVVLFVGSGFRRKGVIEFLEMLALLQTPSIRAFVVGRDRKTRYYSQMAERLGLGKRVVFTGARSDVANFYAVADLLLLPTRYDPFANVTIEAMSHQTAVITTRQNGAHEILDPVFVMDHSRDYCITAVIDALLQDRDKLTAVKKRNREIARCFSLERNVEETMRVVAEARLSFDHRRPGNGFVNNI